MNESAIQRMRNSGTARESIICIVCFRDGGLRLWCVRLPACYWSLFSHSLLLSRLFWVIDLKTAETKDDILAQLHRANIRFDDIDQAQLEDEITNGSAQNLARSLHHRLLVRPFHTTKLYFKKLKYTRTLQVMVLCNVINRLLQRSELSMSDYGQHFVEDLTASLPRVLRILAYETGDSTFRVVTMSSCIRIMTSMATKECQESIPPLIDSLLILFTGAPLLSVPSDILIDAASAIASLVTLVNDGRMVEKVKEESGALISILSNELTGTQPENALVALSQLGRIPVLCSIMTKRRGLLTALNKLLFNSSVAIREKNIALISMLVSSYTAETSLFFECNLTLMARALAKAASKETNLKVKMTLVKALGELILKKDLDREHADEIMTILFIMAISCDTPDGPAIDSALSYLRAACNMAQSTEILSNVVHFTTSPFAMVRITALDLLKDITFWKPDSTALLLASTDMLERFCLIVTHGCNADCFSVTEICKQIVFENQYHATFCSNLSILSAFVCFVSTEPAPNRAAYTVAVGVLLDLMATQLNHFLQFSDLLLPWLVKMANRTSDENLNARFVSTIIRYSSAILDKT